VEDILVGQTKSDGTVTARVPSGRVRITASLYPTSGGEQFATLTPESEETVSLILASGKEIAKETELMLAESSDGVLSRSVASITLRFRDDAGSLEIARVESVDLVSVFNDFLGRMTDLFRVKDGAIVATDAQRAIDAARKHTQPVVLGVMAVDAEGIWHYNWVEFTIK
jgi:hypothetical protein